MGNVQLRLGNNQQDLDDLSSALELLKQIEKPGHDLLKREAAGLRDRGFALRRLQRIDDAFVSYGEARDLFHILGDPSGEARILSEIGLINVLMGEYQKSLDYYRQALTLSQSDSKQKGIVLDLMGRVYAQMNDLDLAQSHFREARTLLRKAHYHRFIAYTLNDLGVLWLRRGKPGISQNFHRQALAELQAYEPDDGDGIAETEAYLADAESASEKYKEAIQNYRRALSLQEQSGDIIGEAQTHISLGRAAMVLQDRDLALQSFTRASELYHQVHERSGESTARFQIARLYELQSDYDGGSNQVDAAIALAEEIRTLTPGIHLRTAYFASLEAMYRLKIELLLKQDPVPELQRRMAFDTLQRARSRTLIDALASRMVPEDLACDSNLASTRSGLLAELNKQNQRMQLSIGDRSAVIEDSFLSIRRLETALEEVEAHCRAAQPRMGILDAISLPEVQEQILDQQSALFQFYLADRHSYVWVVTRSTDQLIRLPTRAWLDLQMNRLVKFGPNGAWTATQEKALARFCREVLPALAVPGIQKWIIVPDGALHSLPFTLLASKAGREIEVIKIPSASAIRAIRNVREPASAPQFQLALFADPVFDVQDSRLRGAVHGSHIVARRNTTGGSYARLIYSRHEAWLISHLVPPDEQVSFRDFDARLDAATGDALNRFRLVHFATHSIVNDRHPDFSGIVFSLVARDGRRLPGYLFLQDIYRMKLRSDLVVLSSCASALGHQQASEGPMSLARGFLYAGSRAVMASLWEVDDEATAEFMGLFYRHMLKDKLTPSETLARTQAEFRHHPNRKLRNPYYWAGFELYGDWQVR